MLDPKDVTACLVTRGNVDMTEIRETLPFEKVFVWDNSVMMDLRVFGRYEAVKYVDTPYVAWQDDDVLFTEWEALLEQAEPDVFTSNNAHGPNHGGYNDLALQAAGAIIPVNLIHKTWKRWYDVWPLYDYQMKDTPISRENGVPLTFLDGFLWEADFIFGVLCPRWTQFDLPYTRLYADDNTRLCRQPWQEDLKLYMANLAREIRDANPSLDERDILGSRRAR